MSETTNHAKRGIVYLVGAGPGAPDLITIRGSRVLNNADVVVFDRLVDRAMLQYASKSAELIDLSEFGTEHGKRQKEINQLLVDNALQGKLVVRLKGGDPLIFGRGYEEALACHEHGIASVVVPGVTSAISAPAAVGIPLTERKQIRSFGVVTGMVATECKEQHLDFKTLAGMDALVVMMGRAQLPAIVSGLIENGKPADTPAACVQSATTVQQQVVVSTLGKIVEDVERAGLTAPVVTVVGAIALRAADDPQKIAGPLCGRRIAVTRPVSSDRLLVESLQSLGAQVLECPLSLLVTAPNSESINQQLGNLAKFDWTLLTSSKAVAALLEHLECAGMDIRSLGTCRVGVVGPGTAQYARSRGIRPDLQASPHTAVGLIETLASSGELAGSRILLPQSDKAESTLFDGLTARGAHVERFCAYENRPADPASDAVQDVRELADTLVFCSPSTVRRGDALGLMSGPAKTIVCIGPTTASELERLGHQADIVPEVHTGTGLIQAIVQHALA